jgi:hypothetical protein
VASHPSQHLDLGQPANAIEKLLAKYPKHQGLASMVELKSTPQHMEESWSTACTDDASSNLALLFKPGHTPGTWRQAKKWQNEKCLDMYPDNKSLCSRVIKQLFADRPRGGAPFSADKKFCEESFDLFQAASLQLHGTTELLEGRRRKDGGTHFGVCNVCTSLYKAGRLPEDIWSADNQVGHVLMDNWLLAPIMYGYQLWSRPFSRWMLRSPLLLNMVEPFGASWAKTMAWTMGSTHPEAQPHILAFLVCFVGVPICYVLGIMMIISQSPTLGLFLTLALGAVIARRRQLKTA